MNPPALTVLGCLGYGIQSLPYIAPYFIISLALTFYNQWLFSGGGDHELPFPLSITVVHLTFTLLVIWVIRRWSYPGCRDDKPVTLSWKDYIIRATLPAIAGGLDIGLSNWSMVYITVSLYAMSKSTTIIFILFFSILLRLEKFTWYLLIVVALIFSGVLMFTYHKTTFNTEGFILVILAALLGGLRWTFSQVLMQNRESGLSNPVDIVFHLIPMMLVVLAPMAIAIEGTHVATSPSLIGATTLRQPVISLTYIFGGAVLACLLNLTEFLLLAKTSSLTLSIVGTVKEICIFPIAAIRGDPFSPLNIAGCVVCISGIILHVAFKASRSEDSKSTLGLRSVGKISEIGSSLGATLSKGRRRNLSKENLGRLMQEDNSSEDDLIFATSGV